MLTESEFPGPNLFELTTVRESNQTYRPEIDGLRALAVVMVVLFHARLGCTGGYTGVDVFFVISGFLITGIVVRSLDQSTFTLRDFWLRRIRRLFPASCVLVLASAIIGWLCTPPTMYAGLGEQILAVLSLSSNVYFWKTTDYWSLASEDIVLLHMWSLALEEQFYLAMPFVLIGLHRLGRRWIVTGLALATLGSLALCIAMTHRAPAWSFYLLPTRAWELLAGALLACVPHQTPSIKIARAASAAAGWIGIVLIAYGAFFFTPTMPFPGWRALVPAIGTVLLLYSTGTVQGELQRLLASPPLRFIGLLSYSLYLWHWPLLVFSRFAFPAVEDNAAIRLSAVAAAFVISWASWRFIETPFRQPAGASCGDQSIASHLRWRRTLFAASLAAMAACGMIIVATRGASLLSWRGDNQASDLLSAARNPSHATENDGRKDGWMLIGRRERQPAVVILGSSHGTMYVPALHACLDSLGVGGAVFARAAENPLIVDARGWRKAGEEHLVERDDKVRTFLNDKKPRCVLCFHRWSSGSDEAIPFSRRRTTSIDEKAAALAGWVSRSAATWAECGATVIVVGEVPQSCSSRAMFEALVYRGACYGTEPSNARMVRRITQHYLEDASHSGYRFVAVDLAIQTQPPLTEIRSPDEAQLYFIDDNHLSAAGGDVVCRKILCEVIGEVLGAPDASRRGHHGPSRGEPGSYFAQPPISISATTGEKQFWRP